MSDKNQAEIPEQNTGSFSTELSRITPTCDNCGTFINVTKSQDNIYRCGKCRMAIMLFLIDQINRIKRANGHRYTVQTVPVSDKTTPLFPHDTYDVNSEGQTD